MAPRGTAPAAALTCCLGVALRDAPVLAACLRVQAVPVSTAALPLVPLCNAGSSGAGAASALHVPRGPNYSVGQLGTGNPEAARVQVPTVLHSRFTGVPVPLAPSTARRHSRGYQGWAELLKLQGSSHPPHLGCVRGTPGCTVGDSTPWMGDSPGPGGTSAGGAAAGWLGQGWHPLMGWHHPWSLSHGPAHAACPVPSHRLGLPAGTGCHSCCCSISARRGSRCHLGTAPSTALPSLAVPWGISRVWVGLAEQSGREASASPTSCPACPGAPGSLTVVHTLPVPSSRVLALGFSGSCQELLV